LVEHGVAIVEKYDRKSLFPTFLIYYLHLHPLYEVESSLAYRIDEDRSLDIFGMAANVIQNFIDIRWMQKYQMPFGMVKET